MRSTRQIHWRRVWGVAAALVLAAIGALGATTADPADVTALIPIRTPAGYTIHAELADTPLKRAQGLMYREVLPDDRGMLFIFGESQAWTFWMKNTKLALDIIWMNEQKKIVHIEPNVPICTLPGNACPQYQPNDVAMYVLELRGGRAESLKLTKGMKLQF
ncbi:MAG: DUF192 domain-containing protein [Nitrospiraceae bacterium]